MQKSGKMWIIDNDPVFVRTFGKTGDKFDVDSLNMALRHIKQWRVAIDGGAHYGSWTRSFASRFEKVVAIEPRDELYECLERNVEDYDNVVLIKSAVGNKEDTVEVGPGGRFSNPGTCQVIGPGETPLITIDSLNLDNVDFIKLDVEGYELFALEGAEQTIKKFRPVIHIEDKGHGGVYGVQRGAAGKYLENLGATMLDSLHGRDFVYGWE